MRTGSNGSQPRKAARATTLRASIFMSLTRSERLIFGRGPCHGALFFALVQQLFQLHVLLPRQDPAKPIISSWSRLSRDLRARLRPCCEVLELGFIDFRFTELRQLSLEHRQRALLRAQSRLRSLKHRFDAEALVRRERQFADEPSRRSTTRNVVPALGAAQAQRAPKDNVRQINNLRDISMGRLTGYDVPERSVYGKKGSRFRRFQRSELWNAWNPGTLKR